MLQQPLARRVAGAARYAAAGEALPGALPLSSMRRRARGLRAAPFQPMERQMPGRARRPRGLTSRVVWSGKAGFDPGSVSLRNRGSFAVALLAA